MYVFTDPKTGFDVDLLVAAGQPEATILEEAPSLELMVLFRNAGLMPAEALPGDEDIAVGGAL
jgi:hypothetical protein